MQRLDFDTKGKQHGHNISHSKRHTKRAWKPNLQTTTLVVDGKKVRVKISTSALRSMKKKGLLNPTDDSK